MSETAFTDSISPNAFPAVTAVLSGLLLVPYVVHVRELWRPGAGAGWPLTLGSLVLEIARTQPAATGLWPFAALVAPIVSPPASRL